MDGVPTTGMDGVASPKEDMQDGFEDGDPCKPAVKKVESVVRNFKHPDERVVSKREEDRGNEIKCCQRSSTATKGGDNLFDGSIIRNGQGVGEVADAI